MCDLQRCCTGNYSHLSLLSHKFAGTFFCGFELPSVFTEDWWRYFLVPGQPKAERLIYTNSQTHSLARSLAHTTEPKLATNRRRPGLGRLSSRFAGRRRFGCIWRPDVFLSPRGSAGPAPGSRPVDHLPSAFCLPPVHTADVFVHLSRRKIVWAWACLLFKCKHVFHRTRQFTFPRRNKINRRCDKRTQSRSVALLQGKHAHVRKECQEFANERKRLNFVEHGSTFLRLAQI